jgi:radical SAM protein with 4Fe4S-binding SPASM domain
MTHTLFRLAQKIIPNRKIRYYCALLYYKIDHILKYKTTDLFIAVEIETNTSCNRRCSYCPNSIFDRSLIKNAKYMKTKLYKKLINELSDMKFIGRISPHFFGEPLLDKRLPKLMEYTREKLPDANIVIFTNGDLLSIDTYKKLVKAGVDAFNITEHGLSMSPNMKNVFNYRKKIDQKYPLINYIDLKKAKYLNNRGGLVIYESWMKKKACTSPSENIIIDYAGNVILCFNDYLSSIKFGNINNEKLFDIWKKPEFKKIRRDLKKGIFKLPICIKCKPYVDYFTIKNM